MKIFLTLVAFIICNQMIFCQLEFTEQKKLFFVGSDIINGKKIISGVYISPIDKNNLNLKISVLDNWIEKELLNISVKLDKSSLNNNVFFINNQNKRKTAYRYFNENGIEIFIAKEEWHDNSYNQKGEKIDKFYTMSIVEVKLPKNKKFYVKELPLMYEK